MTSEQSKTHLIEGLQALEAYLLPKIKSQITRHPDEQHRLVQVGFHDIVYNDQSYPDLMQFYNLFGHESYDPALEAVRVHLRAFEKKEGSISIRAGLVNKYSILDSFFMLGPESAFAKAPTLVEQLLSGLDSLVIPNSPLHVHTHAGVVSLAPKETNYKGLFIVLSELTRESRSKTPPISFLDWNPSA